MPLEKFDRLLMRRTDYGACSLCCNMFSVLQQLLLTEHLHLAVDPALSVDWPIMHNLDSFS